MNLKDEHMKNPWLDLYTEKQYKAIATCDDVQVLEIYNQSRKNKNEILQLDLPTTNVIGSPETCQVAILLLNPGYSESDYEDVKNQDFVDAMYYRNDFWVLDNRFSNTNAYRWWNQKLANPVIQFFDEIHEDIIRNQLISSVCCIEYFPYHSTSFSNDLYTFKLPSQEFAFDALRKVIKRDVPIILAKGKLEFWAYQVKEIYNYPHLYKTSSQQNSTISKNNLLEKVNQNKEWSRSSNFNHIFNFISK
jgi:hypothetical protein